MLLSVSLLSETPARAAVLRHYNHMSCLCPVAHHICAARGKWTVMEKISPALADSGKHSPSQIGKESRLSSDVHSQAVEITMMTSLSSACVDVSVFKTM